MQTRIFNESPSHFFCAQAIFPGSAQLPELFFLSSQAVYDWHEKASTNLMLRFASLPVSAWD
jgi:hypothetical protein